MGKSLRNPVLDIHYNARQGAGRQRPFTTGLFASTRGNLKPSARSLKYPLPRDQGQDKRFAPKIFLGIYSIIYVMRMISIPYQDNGRKENLQGCRTLNSSKRLGNNLVELCLRSLNLLRFSLRHVMCVARLVRIFLPSLVGSSIEQSLLRPFCLSDRFAKAIL